MTRPGHPLGGRALLSAAGLFLVLASIHTWPLVTDLKGLSRNNNADTMLNEWAVSWVAHQLPRAPTRLFEANIFHPHPHTLAYSEPLILPGVMGAPLRWLGATPVLTYNVLLLVGFTLAGLAMYVAVAVWTKDHLAAIVAGAVFAFNAHTMTRLPHLQAIHSAGLPLAILAFDRLLTRARTRDAVWMACFVLLCALTSGHLVVFAVFALSAALLARPEVWWTTRRVAVLVRLVGAAAATLLVGVLVLWPYQTLNQGEFRRPLDGLFTAGPWSYLSTAAWLHYELWSHRVFRVLTEETLFPGVTTLGLCGVALVARQTGLTAQRRMFAAIGVVGFVMALGTATPLYGWLYHLLPPLQGMRSAARFGFLVIVAVAALAGFGLATMRARWPGRRMTMVAVGVLALVTLEALHTPIPYVAYDGISTIYRPIAADPERIAVLELPIFSGGSIANNATYMLASTTHWKPLINGFSGYSPPGFDAVARRLMQFPSLSALDILRELHVRYVVLHVDSYANRMDALRVIAGAENRPDLELVETDGPRRLYRLRGIEPMS